MLWAVAESSTFAEGVGQLSTLNTHNLHVFSTELTTSGGSTELQRAVNDSGPISRVCSRSRRHASPIAGMDRSRTRHGLHPNSP